MKSRATPLLLLFVAFTAHAQLTGITKTPINGGPKFPNSMVAGPDGNTWFTDFQGNTVGRLTPDGTVTTFPLPSPNSVVDTITAGMDGNLWFTEDAGRIGRVTPLGAITEFPIGNAINPTALITSGADGALYFLDQASSFPPPNVKLGRITTNGSLTTYDLGSKDTIVALLAGPNGNIWFYDTTKNAMVEFDIVQRVVGTTHPVPLPAGTFANHVLRGLDNNLWFTHGNNIARMKADGTLTEYPVPTANAKPSAISLGGDGNIWFAEYQANKLGQLVVKTATDSGSATVNESGAILNNGSIELVPVVSHATSGKIGATDTIPCSSQTFISRFTVDGVWYYITWTGVVQSPCADIQVHGGYNMDQRLSGTIKNGGPSAATNVVMTLYVTGSISDYETHDAATRGTVAINGNSLTLTIPTLASGESGWIRLKHNTGDLTVTGVSDTPDPDVKNNVDYLDLRAQNSTSMFCLDHPVRVLAPVPAQRGAH